jgi:hypothetical protein
LWNTVHGHENTIRECEENSPLKIRFLLCQTLLIVLPDVGWRRPYFLKDRDSICLPTGSFRYPLCPNYCLNVPSLNVTVNEKSFNHNRLILCLIFNPFSIHNLFTSYQAAKSDSIQIIYNRAHKSKLIVLLASYLSIPHLAILGIYIAVLQCKMVALLRQTEF